MLNSAELLDLTLKVKIWMRPILTLSMYRVAKFTSMVLLKKYCDFICGALDTGIYVWHLFVPNWRILLTLYRVREGLPTRLV